MSWIPLESRIAQLPLILCGPIVRRVEPGSVTVWLALKEPRHVMLRVYAPDDTDAKKNKNALNLCMEGTHATVRLGDHLHVVAVTARATANEQALLWGRLYYYDLFFRSATTAPFEHESEDEGDDVDEEDAMPQHLASPGILAPEGAAGDPLQGLVYEGHPLPGFVLPPQDINQLRIVHGSCRKAHGDGREMLSTVDMLLADTAHDPTQRPQQLYLTGDQIYADDVAAPLLFALIDAGRCLFAGNTEEVLPSVHKPASTFAPGNRRTIVHNEALLTTSTPQNHLLSFSEYASMYLYCWSDILWPEELPDAETIWQRYREVRPFRSDDQLNVERQYREQNKKLQHFRAHLPQVRRALANIATYMICDDHEITDDWYLDGAWCRQVLSRPLGRRILRNAILAYALFQAWGNTPDQFAGQNGRALLTTLNAWCGDEDWQKIDQLALIEEIIGLPASFDGTGELPHLARALHWHYTYEGPQYRVIVMDTRTQRHYRSPEEFPGLLSQKAMERQITAHTGEGPPVTILISATPVVGVDFIESIQFWSRWRVRDNYAYDREAWALEWGTFQRFLKTISKLKRVVILSGDVHYAFGSSMEYWDYHHQSGETSGGSLGEDQTRPYHHRAGGTDGDYTGGDEPRPYHHRAGGTDGDYTGGDEPRPYHHRAGGTARFVNYTSSSLCNEGSGSHMAVLAVGYPRLLHLLRHQSTPTLDFFAWDINESNHHFLDYLLTIINRRIYRIWWSLPRLMATRRSPDEIVLPARGWLKGTFDAFWPDRSYRLRYLTNTLAATTVIRRSFRVTLSRWLLQPVRLALGLVTLLEGILRRFRGSIGRRIGKIRQAPELLQHPAHALVHETVQSSEAIEQQLEKRRNRLVEAIFHYGRWLNRWKAGSLIVGYNNIGEIRFRWDEEQQEIMQRLWWYRPGDGDDSEGTLQMADYRDTLALPSPEMEPPLP